MSSQLPCLKKNPWHIVVCCVMRQEDFCLYYFFFVRPCVTWISFFISRHAEQEKATMEAELFFKPLLGDLSVWVRVESALDPKFRTVCAFFFFPIDDTIRRDFRNKSSSHLYNMNPLWPWSLLKKKKKTQGQRFQSSARRNIFNVRRLAYCLAASCFFLPR